MSKRIVAAMLVAAMAATSAAASGPPSLWVSDTTLGAAVLEVDPVTGARALVDLEDYPLVMRVGSGVATPSGQIYLEATNAAQGRTVVRFDPANGETVGVSGYVDRGSDLPRGAGPGFEPRLVALELGPWGTLYALRSGAGPMAVDVATGDRMVISQSVDPPVGSGVELLDPVDLVVERRGSLLVADRLAGLVRVAVDSGSRRVAFVFQDLVEGQHRLGRLPDSRVVHAFGAGDGQSITVFDHGLRVASELSGPGRGTGPELLGIGDLTVAPDGTIYVLDRGRGAIVAVDPVSGDRRVVSDDQLVSGDEVPLGLLSPGARLVGYSVPSASPSPRAPARRVGRPQGPG